MELSLGEVSAAFKALQNLAKPENEMPIGAAVKVRRLIKLLEVDAQTAIDKQNALIKKYGKDIGGGNIGVRPQDGESFIAYLVDLQPVLNEKVEIALEPFPLKEIIGNPRPSQSGQAEEPIRISVVDLVALEKIITP